MYRVVDAGRSTPASVRFQGAMFLKGPVWGSSSRRWSCPTKPGTAGGRVQSSEAAFGPHLMTGQVRTPKRPSTTVSIKLEDSWGTLAVSAYDQPRERPRP